MATRRRSARGRHSSGIPAWFWLVGGILIGLGVAVVLMLKGYLPQIKRSTSSHPPKTLAEPALIEDKSTANNKPAKPRYDFFTVLPEMEVVVPDQELSRKARPVSSKADPKGQLESYILQAGSFRGAADAEQMKARLALLGSMANVQKVTVNGETWHRVRIGPFKGARKTNEVRQLLADNKIDTLVMKANP